ncbi:MAG: TrmH family RNA methyltransferase [Bacteroidetes bacterium]|nr:TrmH family RNA methyltransferase [Bacteroidota bacterium]
MKFISNDLLGRPDLEGYRSLQKIPVAVVLDDVRSGLNVGSVFRSSDSFLIEKIILCGITAKPPERDILKSALGATESVVWEYFESVTDAIHKMKEEERGVFAVEQSSNSIPLQEINNLSNESYALIFGNEVKGVNEKVLPLIDGCIEVPQSGTKHSLNIAVCAGIVLWEFYKKFHLK